MKCKHLWIKGYSNPKGQIKSDVRRCRKCWTKQKLSKATGRWRIVKEETPAEKYKRLLKETKKNKRKNTRCRCNANHMHDSRGEAGYCNKLQLKVKYGKIREFTHEKRFDLKVNGRTVAKHYPDFFVVHNDGAESIHEYKGFADDLWKLKRALTEVLYPDIPYIVIPHK